MINKQRVQRIRGFLYTCIILVIFVPIILMIVVSFQTLKVLGRIADYIEPPAVSQQVPEESGSGDATPDNADPSTPTPEPQGQSLVPGSDVLEDNAEEPQEATGSLIQDHQSSPEENGRYAPNSYLPTSYPGLYFDTVPLSTAYRGNTLYLTFDNTPSSQADEILAVLKKHEIKATFFVWWNDSMQSQNNTFYRDLALDGHRIGIHSGDSSKSFSQLYSSKDTFLEDFNKIFEVIYQQTGSKPRLYRLPGGSVNPYNSARQSVLNEIKAELDSRGFIQYDWNASAQDAVRPALSKSQVLTNLKNSVSDTGQVVVLLHDGTGSTSTAEALDEFISQYKTAGYAFGVLEYDAEPVSFISK